MPVTVPLGTRRRFSIGHTREVGWWAVTWRKPSDLDWLLGRPDDEPPDGGVREPRRPPLTPRSGAAVLPEPD